VAKPGSSLQGKSERKPGFTRRGIIKDIQKDPTKDPLNESNVIEARMLEVGIAVLNDAATSEPKPEQPAKGMVDSKFVKYEALTEEPTPLDRVPTPAGLELVKSEARTEEPTPLDRVPAPAGLELVKSEARTEEPTQLDRVLTPAGLELVKSEARTEEPTPLDRVLIPAGLELVKSEARTEEPTPPDRVSTSAEPPKPTVSAPTPMEEPKKSDPEPPAKANRVPLKPKLNDSSEKSWARNVGKKGPVDPTPKASVDPTLKASEKKTSNRPKESPMTSTKPSSKKANGSFLEKLIGKTEQKYGRPSNSRPEPKTQPGKANNTEKYNKPRPKKTVYD
jgi:hypothetical protein